MSLRLFVRNPDKIQGDLKTKVEIAQGSTFEPDSLQKALTGIDTAYYLIHSMGAGKEYRQLDLDSARNFRDACIAADVKQIIYLGGLGTKETASQHLLSRIETGEMLSAKPEHIQTVWIRAAVIIGAGSASFEIIRHLVKKLPIMTTPRWVRTRTQPISIEDVLDYLVQAKDLSIKENVIVDIGSEPMSFGEMLTQAAQVMGLKRTIIPIRFFSPRLSSYWLKLVTPVNFKIARELVEGLKAETLVQNDNARLLFGDIQPRSYQEAVKHALSEN
jgi:uncharacterized protein YbjT (DUF2867 family)